MKTLSTAAASAALGIDRKTLDNVLSREGRSFFGRRARGHSRRIPVAVVERLAVGLILGRDLGVGIARGLELAELLLASPAATVTVGSLTSLAFDMLGLRKALDRSIDEALESMVEPTRGRPKA